MKDTDTHAHIHSGTMLFTYRNNVQEAEQPRTFCCTKLWMGVNLKSVQQNRCTINFVATFLRLV